ncbi:hypothetical protein PpBr36_08887 [Pyricularia pennisetigena]|uniref:hypothetical protein n=1 Tax=Pyricularia pennisetigena TaxID=1578925 RepID=UPI001153DFBD|nr:hypothetical protein PpBr36_08887 [Pyricularia pennisetigena]TLS24548.1 hypothetical protein PpBr36_08887 [Pyricularia pennisetigena]
MAPSTQKQLVITGSTKAFDDLKLEASAPVPKPGENEVLVKLHGASLNYRDLIIPRGQYPFPLDLPVVAGSDGAGEVIEVGSKVKEFKVGDRVVTLFNQGHQFGPVTLSSAATGLGGVLDGTLRQYGVFAETGLVRAPENLDFVESASLTCAGLTSWNALYGCKPVKPGDVVLVQGTGGVSLFALQFAKAAGCTVIATSSSQDKLGLLKKLGADHVINYNEDKNWGETARKLTKGGEGVDNIIEVGGLGTFEQSLKAIKYEGIISVIGFLGGAAGDKMPSVISSLSNICTIRGTYVGPRSMMEDMIRAIEVNNIHPVMDKTVFSLDQIKEAYEYMWNKKHIGKMSIKID